MTLTILKLSKMCCKKYDFTFELFGGIGSYYFKKWTEVNKNRVTPQLMQA